MDAVVQPEHRITPQPVRACAVVASLVLAAPLALAQDASDRIACDTGTGFLYYDADGAGGAAAIAFAAVGTSAAATLDHTDFMIVS